MKLENQNNMKQIICTETELIIDAYLEGMVPSEDKQKMQSHLAGCKDCRKYLEETVILLEKAALLPKNDEKLLTASKKTELWNKIEAKTILAPKTNTDSHIYNMSGLEDEDTPARSKGSGSLRYYMSGIAAVLVLAFVFYGVNQFLKKGNSIDTTVGTIEVGAPKWMVTSLKGSPMINDLVMKAIDSLAIGGYITTDDRSRAELYVAGLGSVIIEPNSKVRLTKSVEGERRISLEYGSIDANILAKPRTFFVDAGTVTAVDLGCSYKFSVDKTGDGLLYVRTGMVSLESANGRESIVPEGKFCVTKQNVGPGTPFREDSSPLLKNALMEFDFGTCGGECVNAILKNAKKTDAVTLVNIIPRVEEQYKTRVYDRVAFFFPPPKNIPTDSIPRLKKLENLNEWVDKIMEEVHKNIEENMDRVGKQVEEQMKQVDDEKWQKDWNKEWQKQFDKNVKKNWEWNYQGDDSLTMFRDGHYPTQEEMEELNRDMQELQKDLQIDNEDFKKEMQRVKEELQRVNEEIKREMEKVNRESEKELRETEKEQRKLEKQQRKMEEKQREMEKKREKEEKNDDAKPGDDN